jgi:hypothetical protein
MNNKMFAAFYCEAYEGPSFLGVYSSYELGVKACLEVSGSSAVTLDELNGERDCVEYKVVEVSLNKGFDCCRLYQKE